MTSGVYTAILLAIVFLVIVVYVIGKSAGVSKYKDRFQCRRCGRCCTVYKIMVNRRDIERIEALGHDRKDFVERRKASMEDSWH